MMSLLLSWGNPNLRTGFEQAIVILNAVGAGVACGWNLAAAARLARMRKYRSYLHLHAVVAALAAGYVVAYCLLLLADIEVRDWSAFFRGVSLLTWPIVWTGPAVLHVRRSAEQRTTRALIGEVTRLLESDAT